MANLPPDIDFSLDRHASPTRMNRAMEYLNKRLVRVESNAPDAIAIEAATNASKDASKAALSADHARIWAEQFPDHIPQHVLDAMGISGEHWSSRWWAEKSVKSAKDAEAVAKILEDLRNRYLGAHVGPPSLSHNNSPLAVGDMYFCTVDNLFYVYTGTKWEPAGGAAAVANTTQDRVNYVATGGSTTFPAKFTAPFVDVYVNGLHLTHNLDFTLTLTDVIISSPLNAGDIVDIVPYRTYSVAAVNSATAAQIKNLYESNANTNCLTDALLKTIIGIQTDRTYIVDANQLEPQMILNESVEVAIPRLFKALFTNDPAINDLVIVEGGGGAAAALAGVYVMIPPIAAGGTWGSKFLSSGRATQQVKAFVKLTRADPDPDPTKEPVGSAIWTLEDKHKAIAIVTPNGTIQNIFDEDTLKQWVAAGNLFQGTIPTEGALATLPKPTPNNKGWYWTFTAQPNYIVGASSGSIKNDLLGKTLQIGDWIQSDGAVFVHVPGDLLSKARWETLGAFSQWTAGSYEKGALVVYRASAGLPLRYYRAKQAVHASDGNPAATPAVWEDISPAYRTRDLTDVELDALTLAAGHIIQWNGTKFVNINPKAKWLKLSDLDTKLAAVAHGDSIKWNDGDKEWVPAKFSTIEQPEQRVNNLILAGVTFAFEDILDIPPVNPIVGQTYVVGPNPQGDFQLHANELAFRKYTEVGLGAGAWEFKAAEVNRIYWRLANKRLVKFDGTNWVDALLDPVNIPPAPIVGLADWDAAHSYTTLNQICVYQGAIYRCIEATNNLNQEPDKAPLFWGRLSSQQMSTLSDVNLVVTPPQNDYVLTYVTDHWEAKPLPEEKGIADWKAATAYKKGAVVIHADKIWRANAPAYPNVSPDTDMTPTPVLLTGKLVTGRLDDTFPGTVNITKIEPASHNALVAGDMISIITTGYQLPYTIPNGPFAGTVLTTSPSFLAVVDKADVLGIQGYQFINGPNIPTGTVNATPGGSVTNPWTNIGGGAQADSGQPMVYYGPGAFNNANVVAPLFGMATGTLPDPAVWVPAGGDLYIDTTSGIITQLVGTGGTPASPTGNRADPVTSGTTTTIDVMTGALRDLSDVNLGNNPIPMRAVLSFDAVSQTWKPDHTTYATKAFVDTAIDALATGLSHGVAVITITNNPPPGAVGRFYIVGNQPTGVWVGHANEVAHWAAKIDQAGQQQYEWEFNAPRMNETHLVEDEQANYSWNGTAWVKVASSGPVVTSKRGIGEIIPWLFPTVPADYLPCDGRVVSISSHRPLYDVIGNTYNAGTGADGTTTFALPDLRGIFLRGMKAAGSVLGAKHNWTTGRSKTPMTTSSNGDHKHYDGAFFHQPPNKYGTVSNNTTATVIANTGSNFSQHLTNTSTDGAHTHTINGGGDAETAPDHMYVNFVIRAVAIEGGAKGEKGDTGQDGDGWLVGDIKQSILTEAQFKAALPNNESLKWVLADGRDVSGSRYSTITGRNNVPDLRGAFLRMAGQNATNASWVGGNLNSYQEDTTRAPRNTAFTTDSQGNHQHANGAASWGGDAVWYGSRAMPNNKRVSNWSDWSGANPLTSSDGAHTHTITGGDTESRPKNYNVNYFIRIG